MLQGKEGRERERELYDRVQWPWHRKMSVWCSNTPGQIEVVDWAGRALASQDVSLV